MLDERITADFALSEFIVSHTAARMGIDNMPPARAEAELRATVAAVSITAC